MKLVAKGEEARVASLQSKVNALTKENQMLREERNELRLDLKKARDAILQITDRLGLIKGQKRPGIAKLVGRGLKLVNDDTLADTFDQIIELGEKYKEE